MTWQPDGSFWQGRRVAVTGATGFLGGHLVAMLCDLDAQVTVLVRDDITLSDIVAGLDLSKAFSQFGPWTQHPQTT